MCFCSMGTLLKCEICRLLVQRRHLALILLPTLYKSQVQDAVSWIKSYFTISTVGWCKALQLLVLLTTTVDLPIYTDLTVQTVSIHSAYLVVRMVCRHSSIAVV